MLICSDGFYKRCDERNLKSALYLKSLTDNTAINKRLSALCEDVKKRGEKVWKSTQMMILEIWIKLPVR